jgi:cbb3-type cytochrome oxidase subunit 3
MSSDVDDTVRAFEKERRWRAAEEAMARLRENPDEWAEYQAEAE